MVTTMTTYEPADWEPGDIAWIEADGTEPQHRLLYVTMAGNYRWHGADGFVSDVTSARRLQVVDPASVVTLDPDDPNDVQRLKQALSRWESDRLTDLLRSLLPVVTPPEPNGHGAVVESANALEQWVRGGDGKWRDKYGVVSQAGMADYMHTVTVLSHGVGCSCGAPDCNGGDLGGEPQ